MCGRYASIKAPADLADEFHAVDATEGVEPDYNVAPTKSIVAVVERHPRDVAGTPDPDSVERSLRVVRWGLSRTGRRTRRGGARIINARSESAAEKPAFRRALAARRCLHPGGRLVRVAARRGPQAALLHPLQRRPVPRDGRAVGVLEAKDDAADPDGQYPDGLVTAAVLTAAAVGPLRQIHDRMPLVLPAEAWDTWLNPDTDARGTPWPRCSRRRLRNWWPASSCDRCRRSSTACATTGATCSAATTTPRRCSSTFWREPAPRSQQGPPAATQSQQGALLQVRGAP